MIFSTIPNAMKKTTAERMPATSRAIFFLSSSHGLTRHRYGFPTHYGHIKESKTKKLQEKVGSQQ